MRTTFQMKKEELKLKIKLKEVIIKSEIDQKLNRKNILKLIPFDTLKSLIFNSINTSDSNPNQPNSLTKKLLKTKMLLNGILFISKITKPFTSKK